MPVFRDEKRAKTGRAVGVVGVALFARVGVAVTLEIPDRDRTLARDRPRERRASREGVRVASSRGTGARIIGAHGWK